jgi:hypothetical protein
VSDNVEKRFKTGDDDGSYQSVKDNRPFGIVWKWKSFRFEATDIKSREFIQQCDRTGYHRFFMLRKINNERVTRNSAEAVCLV